MIDHYTLKQLCSPSCPTWESCLATFCVFPLHILGHFYKTLYFLPLHLIPKGFFPFLACPLFKQTFSFFSNIFIFPPCSPTTLSSLSTTSFCVWCFNCTKGSSSLDSFWFSSLSWYYGYRVVVGWGEWGEWHEGETISWC